jgi:hypothetical protein
MLQHTFTKGLEAALMAIPLLTTLMVLIRLYTTARPPQFLASVGWHG